MDATYYKCGCQAVKSFSKKLLRTKFKFGALLKVIRYLSNRLKVIKIQTASTSYM